MTNDHPANPSQSLPILCLPFLSSQSLSNRGANADYYLGIPSSARRERRPALLRYHVMNGSRDGGAVSRIRVAVLASVSTLASVVVSEVHGTAFGIMAGCAALAAGVAAWPASEHKEKSDRHRHEITKKSVRIPCGSENGSTLSVIQNPRDREEEKTTGCIERVVVGVVRARDSAFSR